MTTSTETTVVSRSEERVVVDGIQWALSHGLTGLTATPKSALEDFKVVNPFLASHIPFTLKPSPFSRLAFERALELATDYNLLYHRVSRDSIFLKTTLAKAALGDPHFTGRLLRLYEKLEKEKEGQPQQDNEVCLGLHRSDYMIHQPSETDTPIPLQVEFNTISSSFSNHSARVTRLHKYLIQTHLSSSLELSSLPENLADQVFPETLAEAWKRYENKDSIILMVVQPKENNVFDQRHFEYPLLENHGIHLWRRTLTEIADEATLNAEGRLIIGGKEVALVYFRAGYTPIDYHSEKEWEAREKVERSKSIKCPTIAYQLSGAKKIQQELAKPHVLEKFLPDTEQRERVKASFAGLWGLDDASTLDEIKAMVAKNPQDYVLKPQREGGGNNIYGTEALDCLNSMSDETLGAYVLMEMIKPRSHSNRLVRLSYATGEEECVSELGVYSVIISVGNRILKSSAAGHLLRTKRSNTNEGGVAAGYAFLDTPYLI